MRAHSPKHVLGFAAIIGMALFSLGACANESNQAQIERGHEIAVRYCSRCHAVEQGKTSPVAEAPPFYTFARMWPVEDLEEALAEGIMVGHQNYPMPVFQLEPDEIDALIAYLKTIQLPPENH